MPRVQCPEHWQAQHCTLPLHCLLFVCIGETYPWQRSTKPEQEGEGILLVDCDSGIGRYICVMQGDGYCE